MIYDIIKNSSSAYNDKIAFVSGDKQFTFQEIDFLSNRLANHFLSLGLKKGDVVAVQLPNSWEFVITHLAISRIGLVFNPLSPAYRKKELKYMLSHCDTKAFITVDTYKNFNHENLANELKPELKELEHVIINGQSEEHRNISLESLLDTDVPENSNQPSLPVKTDPALIMFTSGTESNPKAVLHTYESFVPAHLINSQENQLTAEDRILSLTPLCHMFSLPLIMSGMKYGATQYILDNYQIDRVMDIIEKEKITYLTASPAHLIDIVHFIRGNQEQNLQLRLIQTGGSKIPSQLVKDLRRLIGASIISQWGMTEICAGTFTRPDDKESLAWETVGKPTLAGRVIIVDEKHRMVLNRETGQVAFKGECLFRGYYKNELATEQAFTEDGYFLTGDQGWLDDEGYLHFVGRKKDTINRGGLKYHASEIEEILQMHPGINQVAVVSVPDERLGERACAFVSLRENMDIDLSDIKEFLLDKGIATYKLPEFLQIKSDLPTTPSGKFIKGPLRREAESLALT
ncbi:class I adenylate-forming enzyme family protein [Virgibacillus ainsalahensis]